MALHIHLYEDSDFKEEEHPRSKEGENAGQFVKKGEGGGSSSSTRRELASAPLNRDHWPSHIKKLKLPPAWTNIRISLDPKAALQAIGYDSKGRSQYVYSEKFRDSQTAKKFARIKQLDQKFETILKRNDISLKSRDPVIREHALVTALIAEMGLRPGSERETGASEKAFGATTLLSEHVILNGKKIELRFTGKKGVKQILPINDLVLAQALQERAKKGGPLFPNVNDASLRRYVAKVAGSNIHTKDLRTLKGTKLAQNLVEKHSPPTSMQEYKKAVKFVATEVSRVLGNTPIVCLQAYINPAVFAQWQTHL